MLISRSEPERPSFPCDAPESDDDKYRKPERYVFDEHDVSVPYTDLLRNAIIVKNVPKIIGIDYGSKKVGIAISDEGGSIAFPKATLSNDRLLIPAVVELIQKENVTAVIVGDSKNAEGKDNAIMEGARAFALELQKVSSVAVHFEPEFYSSQEARMLTGKTLVDAEAAAIILNSYLDRKKNKT